MPDPTPTTPALRVGDRIKDNDPRVHDKFRVIIAIVNGKATAEDQGHCVRISLSRIHLDGKPRRSGWSVVR